MHGLRIVLKPTIEREDNNMSMKGIDVSGWQKGIDLSKIDCDFVIVKATQGTGFTSEDYERQATQAKSWESITMRTEAEQKKRQNFL